MSTTDPRRRQHGPVTGDPALRSLPPPGTALPSRRHYRRLPIQKLGCLSTYDYLFKVPVTFTLQKDGVRDVDLEFQRTIDEVVDRLLKEKQIPHFRLPSRNRSCHRA